MRGQSPGFRGGTLNDDRLAMLLDTEGSPPTLFQLFGVETMTVRFWWMCVCVVETTFHHTYRSQQAFSMPRLLFLGLRQFLQITLDTKYVVYCWLIKHYDTRITWAKIYIRWQWLLWTWVQISITTVCHVFLLIPSCRLKLKTHHPTLCLLDLPIFLWITTSLQRLRNCIRIIFTLNYQPILFINSRRACARGL